MHPNIHCTATTEMAVLPYAVRTARALVGLAGVFAATCVAATVVHAQALPQAAAPSPGISHTLTVFLRGAAIGTEDVAVAVAADGWTITSTAGS
jgi:hypothetical protein